MFSITALRALGYILSIRLGVDLVEMEHAGGKTLRLSWSEFARRYRW